MVSVSVQAGINYVDYHITHVSQTMINLVEKVTEGVI